MRNLPTIAPLILACSLVLGALATAGPTPAQPAMPTIRDLWCESDDVSDVYLNGLRISGQHPPYCGWPGLTNIEHVEGLPLLCGPNLLAVEAHDMCSGIASFIAWFTYSDGYGGAWSSATDSRWLTSRTAGEGWNNDVYYNDGAWAPAVENGAYGSWPFTDPSVVAPAEARWIWDASGWETHNPVTGQLGEPVYFRFRFYVDSPTRVNPMTWGRLKILHR